MPRVQHGRGTVEQDTVHDNPRVTFHLGDGDFYEVTFDVIEGTIAIRGHDGRLVLHPEVSNRISISLDRFK